MRVHSAADEREDQHQLLQIQDQRWLFHHAEKPMVQLHEPLDQGGGIHCLHQHCCVVSNQGLQWHIAATYYNISTWVCVLFCPGVLWWKDQTTLNLLPHHRAWTVFSPQRVKCNKTHTPPLPAKKTNTSLWCDSFILHNEENHLFLLAVD